MAESHIYQPDPRTRSALHLWVVLARCYRSILEVARTDIERHGLSATEFSVLELLYQRGPLTIGAIGSRVLLTSGSTTYVIDKLESRGMLERRACEQDGRVTYVHLLQDGSDAVRRILPEHGELIREIAGVLSDDERTQLTELLRRTGHHARHVRAELAV